MNQLRKRWPEYLIEAWGLGSFMVSAVLFTALLEFPDWGIVAMLPDPTLRRCLIGIAMGLTAMAITYSPWGKRSGAHINPAVTFTFWRLGKVRSDDALCYALAQVLGGTAGVLLSGLLIGPVIAAPSVNYVVTVPGALGEGAALLGELVIAFGMMAMVLFTSNNARLAPYTGLCAGLLVALYVSVESPLSGFGMNPARTLASALPAQVWTSLWLYFVAPITGMLCAAEVYVRTRGIAQVHCAKLQHNEDGACHFNCDYKSMSEHKSPQHRGAIHD